MPSDFHPGASFRNVYKGTELVGSILYDTFPVSGRDEIEVFSLYVKPRYRRDVAPVMALICPLLRDGRPIDTMDGLVLDRKLAELIPRLAKSGRVRMGSQWTARHEQEALLEEKTRALEAAQPGEETHAVEAKYHATLSQRPPWL